MTPTPPTINEPAILAYANAVLNTNYASLDGISDQELNRVYIIAQLDVLLQDHPEARVAMCGEQTAFFDDVCGNCSAAMKGAIECPECGWLDLPF